MSQSPMQFYSSYPQQQQQQQQQQHQQYTGANVYQQQQQQYPSSMGTIPTGSMNTSPAFAEGDQYLTPGILAAFGTSGYPGEPPLSEELGFNFSHIKTKTLAVLNPRNTKNISEEIINDSDLAGPLLFCLAFGTSLLLAGKTHFGYIYGVALFGTVSLHWLFKLMGNQSQTLDFLRTASVIGYCLLPLVFLSAVAIILSLDNTLGYLFAVFCVSWCTLSASGFFVAVLSLQNARALTAYPLAMFYSVFALMAIFVEKSASK